MAVQLKGRKKSKMIRDDDEVKVQSTLLVDLCLMMRIVGCADLGRSRLGNLQRRQIQTT